VCYNLLYLCRKQKWKSFVTQGPKTFHLSFWTLLVNHILHCICFKILFTESEYLVSNWSYTRLLRTITKVKNRIKCVRFSCHRNPLQSSLHYSEIIPANEGLHSVSNKTNRIEIELQLFKLWLIHGHQLNWRIAYSKTPLLFLLVSPWIIPDKWRVLGPCAHFIETILPCENHRCYISPINAA